MRERIVDLLGEHDLILAVGAPAFAYHVEGAGPHVPTGATLCQLTEDPETAAWTPVGISAVGSIRLGVLDLLARPAPRARTMPPTKVEAPRAQASPLMSVAYVLQTLAELKTPDDIVVEEAPSARPVMQAYLPITRSETFYTMDSGGLGYGMPAAVGIALGKPDSRVICLMGDGSSMYSIQALWSAAQLKLPITFVILNNRRYAALQDFAPVFGFSATDVVQGTDLPDIDFLSLAKGMGCAATLVSDPGDLRAVLERALASGAPNVVEVQVA
jgi:benzoylformate decarboxylase